MAECLERGLVQVPKKHQTSKRMWHFIAIDYLHSHLESSDSFSSPAFVLAFERVVSDTQRAIICKTNLVFTENKPLTGRSSSVFRKTDASSKLIAFSPVSHCASRVYASVIFYQWILLANSKTAALTCETEPKKNFREAVFLGGWNYSRKKTAVLAGYTYLNTRTLTVNARISAQLHISSRVGVSAPPKA